jgi:hypothetical protein
VDLDQPVRFIIKDYFSYSSDDAHAVTDVGTSSLAISLGVRDAIRACFMVISSV